jgi:hypothetical protein
MLLNQLIDIKETKDLKGLIEDTTIIIVLIGMNNKMMNQNGLRKNKDLKAIRILILKVKMLSMKDKSKMWILNANPTSKISIQKDISMECFNKKCLIQHCIMRLCMDYKLHCMNSIRSLVL